MPNNTPQVTSVLPSLYNSAAPAWDEIVFAGTQLYGDLEFPPTPTPLPAAASLDARGFIGAVPDFPGIHGFVKVKIKAGRDLESKKAPGKDKHKLIDRGMKRAEVTITLVSWTQTGLDRMQLIIDA